MLAQVPFLIPMVLLSRILNISGGRRAFYKNFASHYLDIFSPEPPRVVGRATDLCRLRGPKRYQCQSILVCRAVLLHCRPSLPSWAEQASAAMCNFETTTFRCGHAVIHRSAWCHHARNDPNHICSGVQVMKTHRLVESEDCNNCIQRHRQNALDQQQRG